MSAYVVPVDANDQTRQLVEAGVAQHVLTEDLFQRRGTNLADCTFWAGVGADQGPGGIREPRLAVVVEYPYSPGRNGRSAHAVTVCTPGDPWLVGDQGVLTADQLALVERLAGSSWTVTAND